METDRLSVLLLENEASWAALISRVVSSLGWTVEHALTLAAAKRSVASSNFDLVIVDRVLDDGEDGLALLSFLQEMEITTFALVISQLGSTNEKVRGLHEGADDYLAKPFDDVELHARLLALARRLGKWTPYATVFLSGPLEIRHKARTVSFEGRNIKLAEQQFDLLWIFAQNAGELLSRDFLWGEVWQKFSGISVQDRVIEMGVSRLRKSLFEQTGLEPIETARNAGYRWQLA
tara:strand:- start:6813 stop:7514 length:702 start_codon:yes stop_codon:yes gene_type:complete